MKLTRLQEHLLRYAIREWIDTWEDYEDTPVGCALCSEYWGDFDGEARCSGCPVMAYTGKQVCRGTPDNKNYKTDASRAFYTVQFGNKILQAAGKEPEKWEKPPRKG